jgi:hypothetical protein
MRGIEFTEAVPTRLFRAFILNLLGVVCVSRAAWNITTSGADGLLAEDGKTFMSVCAPNCHIDLYNEPVPT